MTDNFALSSPHSTAIYLPAVTPNYANASDLHIPKDRQWPTSLHPKDLAFWTGNSNLFNHRFALHSVGSYSVGKFIRSPLFHRQNGSYTLLGDSGGFQIGKGTLKGLKNLQKDMSGNEAEIAWRQNKDAVTWIADTLDTYFDYAMTVDMPLWARTSSGKDSPFHNCSEDQLLQMTLKNLNTINNSALHSVKWLNVLQGTNPTNTLNWYNSVKHYNFSGWSLAGAASWRGGLSNMLHLLLTMRDEGAFEPGKNWIHMLGVSQPIWDVIFTRCQMHLRNINPSLQISYDSASPFITAGRFDSIAQQPKLGSNIKEWSIGMKKIDAVRTFADPTNPFPFEDKTSAISQHLYMHHLVVNDEELESRRIDDWTSQLIANHNIWIYLDAGRRANLLVDTKFDDLPLLIKAGLTAIDSVFSSNNWRHTLEIYRDDLDLLAPNKFKNLHPT